MTESTRVPLVGGRRRQIVEVAAGLFAERGFHGVSMHEIGEAVGTSGPALYKHFAGKEALLGAMLVDISERLLAEGRRRAEEARPEGPRAELAALIRWHVEFALTEPALITVQFRDLASLGVDDRATVRRLQRRYVEIWTAAIQAATGTDAAHARSSAHAVFGLINSTPHSARLDTTEMATLLERMAGAALMG
ncbi:TetR/AcrR family transcriptional regulator [Aeromicrobium sp. Leaf350]|uniref:TetR/AcrR family transcriptional regulator n=1 Tax=Aeromicrobium sp. Leaf350 TaxID=2876565 RepID=UPI001E47C023|nr:TetR/AcrR family transcriptional regulator [Aeromicrobium sp. Leaf350]